MTVQYSERQIATLLVNSYIEGGFRVNLCVPGVSFGFFSTHEADLVSVTKSGYLTEFEIKRTWQDFLHDFKKHTNHFENKVSCLYYVVPDFIADKCLEYLESHEWPAPYNNILFGYTCPVGLIAYNEFGRFKTVKHAPQLCIYTQRKRQEYKLTEAEIHNLARLGTMRYWNPKIEK